MICLYALSYSQFHFSFFLFQNLIFFAYTQICPCKIMNSNLSTVGSCLNLDTKFTIGICEIISTEREMTLAQRQWKWDSNLFSFSLMLGNPNKVNRGKIWGILGTARDTTIATVLRTWAYLEVSDEFIAIRVKINMCRDP